MVGNTPKLRCLDLFSGIGGISVALQPWCETVCYCEIDPYACGVLIKNMAAGNIDVTPIWSDVTTFGKSEIDQIGPIDIICGGFPRQNISVAGKGAGLSGERSGLFFEIIRIIRLARPRYVFLENVPGLLARGMDTVLRELAESGYDARWQVLGAADVGANHHRKRVWILADAESVRLEGQRSGREQKLYAHEGQAVFMRNGEGRGPAHWSTEPAVGRLVNGLPHRVDRLRCLGNSVVPLCARTAFDILIRRLD